MKRKSRNLRDKIRRISVFDLDGTLLKGNSSYKFCQYLYRFNQISSSSLVYAGLCHLRYAYLGMPLIDLHQNLFRKVLSGKTLSTLQQYVEPFLAKILPGALYVPAVCALKEAIHMGHFTVILSNSPSFLVEPIAKFLGVSAWRATEYSLDAKAALHGITTMMKGEEKAQALIEIAKRLQVEKENIVAYSDSFSDVPFLMEAGEVVAVQPDKRLRTFAKKQDWSIL